MREMTPKQEFEALLKTVGAVGFVIGAGLFLAWLWRLAGNV